MIRCRHCQAVIYRVNDIWVRVADAWSAVCPKNTGGDGHVPGPES